MKLKGLSSDTVYLYIVLKQFENTFNDYKLNELIGFTGMSKENILKCINKLNDKGIIRKENLKMKYKTGVEIL